MPDDITVVATVQGERFEFPGELGLALSWLQGPLDVTGQGWVSACMLARINANEVALPISIRGPNPGLGVSSEERAIWSVEEGAFFGNLFVPLDQPIAWFACRGAAQASGEFGGLRERDCAEPDPANPRLTQCGFNYAGDCGSFAASQACEGFSGAGTFYTRCHAAVGTAGTAGVGDGLDGGSVVFQQVVTSYVTL